MCTNEIFKVTGVFMVVCDGHSARDLAKPMLQSCLVPRLAFKLFQLACHKVHVMRVKRELSGAYPSQMHSRRHCKLLDGQFD
jgi:hypothetical protein